jgi:ketosteroid isomerase-like protein
MYCSTATSIQIFYQMNKLIFTGIALLYCSFVFAQDELKQLLDKVLDSWHHAAGLADFDTYFGLMTEDAVFIGTDATEYWAGEEFRKFSKPYFDRGKAWDFTTLDRNIYVNDRADLAWFDELLDTQMEICRGSGIVKKVNGNWKISHYVLSIAVPNENVTELIKLKKDNDSLLMLKLRQVR